MHVKEKEEPKSLPERQHEVYKIEAEEIEHKQGIGKERFPAHSTEPLTCLASKGSYRVVKPIPEPQGCRGVDDGSCH